jgi:hypothetical protein
LLATCFRGILPPVDFRAVCLVRAIDQPKLQKKKKGFKP